jgi:hypothetical protein
MPLTIAMKTIGIQASEYFRINALSPLNLFPGIARKIVGSKTSRDVEECDQSG